MVKLVYFSSATSNAHRFIERLGFDAGRIPLRKNEGPLQVTQPYVLIVPTYGGGNLGGVVPRQVITFLNNPENRSRCVDIISSGNMGFGAAYCLVGDVVIVELGIPRVYRFKPLGTTEDVSRVRKGLKEFW